MPFYIVPTESPKYDARAADGQHNHERGTRSGTSCSWDLQRYITRHWHEGRSTGGQLYLGNLAKKNMEVSWEFKYQIDSMIYHIYHVYIYIRLNIPYRLLLSLLVRLILHIKQIRL